MNRLVGVFCLAVVVFWSLTSYAQMTTHVERAAEHDEQCLDLTGALFEFAVDRDRLHRGQPLPVVGRVLHFTLITILAASYSSRFGCPR